MNLDCTSGSVTVPCPDDGLVVGYAGNATITTTCAGISWATGHPAGGTPNEVVFTPSAPIVIAANTFPFCSIQFNVQILGPSNDTTPNVAEEVAGYNGTSSDAQCDNALSSSVSQAGTIPLCVCNDGDPCTLDTCDHDTGSCTFTPTTCATTTTPSTTTTLMHGCVPPTPDALKCEKAIANALATLVKNLIGCSTGEAKKEVGTTVELSADGDACEAAAESKFDNAVTKIAATGTCPPDVLANVGTVRDNAVTSTAAELQDVFTCPGP